MVSQFPQVPEYIQKLVPYVPGKPIEETQRELGIDRVIKLASNENPLGPSPKAKKAMEAHLMDLHRYPDAGGVRLKESLAQHLGVSPRSLILGNGSNEVINHLIRTYCVPGDSIVTTEAAFIAYKIGAQVHGVKTLEVALDADLCFDVNRLLATVRENKGVRMVFLANPNNPTGTYFEKNVAEELIRGLLEIREGSVVLVLDYAYWEYVTATDLPDPQCLLEQYPHMVVLRTFSKVYGLAGARVGYGVASPEMISHLEKVRDPFNVNSLAQVGAVAALEDQEFVSRSRQLNEEGKKFWENQLKAVGVPYWKSQGNFILVDVLENAKRSGLDVFQASLKQGVIFRPVANYHLPHALRISIGTQEENQLAVEVLKTVLKEKSGIKSI